MEHWMMYFVSSLPIILFIDIYVFVCKIHSLKFPAYFFYNTAVAAATSQALAASMNAKHCVFLYI